VIEVRSNGVKVGNTVEAKTATKHLIDIGEPLHQRQLNLALIIAIDKVKVKGQVGTEVIEPSRDRNI
jgi:hypothetical protein